MSKILICGVDEAGRGPLAGPVVAAAVVLGGNIIEGLRDSKKLSNAQRRRLAPRIRDHCLSYALGVSTVEEIDHYNIRRATMFAMQRAVSGIIVCPDEVLVDGDFVPDFPYPSKPLIGGDNLVEEIMAASILAKTMRDDIMLKYDADYPIYGFAQHKGYCTTTHLQALAENGPCPIHRHSFAPVKKAMVVRKEP
ncbi:ribonuclease HII [Candidatus Persebacteraceae bacterium Df01]|jgi:ribonuclease HII|uniref:Ribonuclease HII n=1 Tax=Candidatus Doriopsillibacter californiensis TaxID=2970740 RepID=A0ABT7QMW6_9GAMM|nr:ribonuclease HII [Candidatus Persebacteraceae bacterium Df01]